MLRQAQHDRLFTVRLLVRDYLIRYPDMHGSILTLPKRYVQTQYDHSTWLKLTELAGLSAGELHEKFGEYLVPDLMYLYQKLLDPNWKTLDMLEHTELTMHKQVRSENAENSPPVLEVSRLGPDELMIDYVSPRRMGGLAVGIARGLAAYYDEADRIDVMPATSEDGERVRIHVRRR